MLYNRTITRFSIQTSGLAFGVTGLCSYRVRGVGGSCAEHLTVESYTIILPSLSPYSHTYCHTSYWYSITHSLFHSRLKYVLFCKSSLPQPFLFLIQDSLLLSLSVKKVFKSVNTWHSSKQERRCLIHFARLVNTLLKDEESP